MRRFVFSTSYMLDNVLIVCNFTQVSSIQDALKQYNDNVTQISNLHARSLNNIDDQAAPQQLKQIIGVDRKLSNDLKRRIKALQAQGGDSRDGKTRRQQVRLRASLYFWKPISQFIYFWIILDRPPF